MILVYFRVIIDNFVQYSTYHNYFVVLLNVVMILYLWIQYIIDITDYVHHRYSPIGVCSLITGALISEENLQTALLSVLFFLINVITVFIIHALILLPVLYVAIVRKNPLTLYVRNSDALLTGLAPASR